MKRILLVVLVLLVSSSVAQAGPGMASSRADTWDFSIRTQYTWAHDFSADNGTSVNVDDDLGWGFGFGYNLSEQFKLGFAFSWHSMYYNATIVNADDPTETTTYGNYLDTSTFSLNGEYTFGKSRLRPYVTGNLGWLAVNTNIVADIDVGCWYYPWIGYICDSYAQTYGTDAFSYGLGLGANFDITPKAFLKVGWDHQWNDLDAMNSNDVLRIEVGFRL